MSGDEVLVGIISTVAASVLWARWSIQTSELWPARGRTRGLGLLRAAPALAFALILAVLKTLAAHDVVDDVRYLWMYGALGLAWVGISAWLFPTAGLHMRDDAVERRNPAASPALAGAILGVAAVYAGGNVGDGPGWWVVVGSAAVATLLLLAAWHLLEALTGTAEAITVERDEAAGWRLGGFLLASGLVLGRAVAGDWVSGDALLQDAFRGAWPVAVLVAVAALVHRASRVTLARPRPPVAARGVAPALAYLLLAAAWLAWAGMPR